MKRDNECNSPDTELGHGISSEIRCAEYCKVTEGCKYFSHGPGNHYCYWEHTTASSCPEGWDSDSYHFYELLGKFYTSSLHKILFMKKSFLQLNLSPRLILYND